MQEPSKAKGFSSRRHRSPSRKEPETSESRPQGTQSHTAAPELQLIYDTAPVGLAFLTPDCRYVQINQRLTEICGLSVADHVGRSVRETVPAVADQVESIVQSVIRMGEPVKDVEVRGQRTDKSNADHVWNTQWHPVQRPDGSIAGVNVVAEDITERKRTEAALAASESALRESEKALRELNETLELRVEADTRERLHIWEATQDLLVVMDLKGKYLSVNPAWTVALGWSEAELLGKSTRWFIHPDDREKTRAETSQLAAGQVTKRFENRFQRKDGAYRWISWKAVPDQERIYAVGRDITELKDAENELRETRRELAQAARRATVAAMSAAIAHEIRQPLAAVVSNANAGLRWLNRPSPDLDEARAAFKRIVTDGYRASEVIQSIRAMFAKSDQERAPLDANELIRETIEFARGELEPAGIAVQLDLAAQLPAISARRGQLQQVILNVVTNASDAMRAVSDRARVLRVTSNPFESNKITISVEDTGTGIDPKDADRIFDPFFSTKSNGMGMGLAICRSIVEAHGGTLSASPRIPHGSIFRLVLPGSQ